MYYLPADGWILSRHELRKLPHQLGFPEQIP
ncbi:phage tail assembly chaperone [Nostoc sp. UIC 10607]|nr:phage tail assembly chaperone [Nostoc sp. NZL]